MKTLKELTIVLCFISLICLMTSCEKETNAAELFLISVDSIKLPEKILANTSFDVLCFGTIAVDGCKSFSHFETEKLYDVITVETWGKLYKNSLACPAVMVYLEGEKLKLKLEIKGTYLLRMKQKDGTYLESQLIIE